MAEFREPEVETIISLRVEIEPPLPILSVSREWLHKCSRDWYNLLFPSCVRSPDSSIASYAFTMWGSDDISEAPIHHPEPPPRPVGGEKESR